MSKVLLIKSESEGSDKFLQQLQINNFTVQSISSIDFMFKNIEPLTNALKSHENYDGIVFTSPRSVIAAKKAFENNIDTETLEAWSIKDFNYTVGEASSKHADEILGIKSKGSKTGNAMKLSTFIIDDYKQSTSSHLKKLLFPCGNLKQNVLEQNLAEHSIELDIHEVYDTIQHEMLDESIGKLGKTDFVVFFSPSSVKHSLPLFAKHTFDLSTTKIIAIGPSTEKCLKSNKIACYAVCESPSAESLLNALK